MQSGLKIVVVVLFLTVSLGTVGRQIAPSEGSRWVVLNVDGDVSFPAVDDRRVWNPHVCGFTGDVVWNLSFDETVAIALKTVSSEGGHVAAGMWWTSGFVDGVKIPLADTQIHVDFDVRVSRFEYEAPGDWLRIALACAVQRDSGDVVYTELDVLDSPATQQHSWGNIRWGGDVIYQFGDVVEFKVDALPLGVWRHYQLDLTAYIDRAWQIRAGDRLESVYLVVESDRTPVDVLVEVDNLWIKRAI
jgi:hypothetical protein